MHNILDYRYSTRGVLEGFCFDSSDHGTNIRSVSPHRRSDIRSSFRSHNADADLHEDSSFMSMEDVALTACDVEEEGEEDNLLRVGNRGAPAIINGAIANVLTATRRLSNSFHSEKVQQDRAPLSPYPDLARGCYSENKIESTNPQEGNALARTITSSSNSEREEEDPSSNVFRQMIRSFSRRSSLIDSTAPATNTPPLQTPKQEAGARRRSLGWIKIYTGTSDADLNTEEHRFTPIGIVNVESIPSKEGEDHLHAAIAKPASTKRRESGLKQSMSIPMSSESMRDSHSNSSASSTSVTPPARNRANLTFIDQMHKGEDSRSSIHSLGDKDYQWKINVDLIEDGNIVQTVDDVDDTNYNVTVENVLRGIQDRHEPRPADKCPTGKGPTPKRRMICSILAIILAVIGATITVLAIRLARTGPSESIVMTADNGWYAFSDSDPHNGVTLENEQEVLQDFISLVGPVAGWDVINNSSTPQHKAMQWMLYMDPLKLPHEYSSQKSSYLHSSKNRNLGRWIAQRFALVSFFYATGGEDWTERTFWLTDANECGWMGITCGAHFSHLEESISASNYDDRPSSMVRNAVTRINLSQNHLQGMLPQELTALNQLELMILSGNALTGTIPSWMVNILSLESLHLDKNSLQGTVPIELGNAAMLEELRLERNELEGEVPTEICQLDLKMLTADCADGKLTCTCCTECFT